MPGTRRRTAQHRVGQRARARSSPECSARTAKCDRSSGCIEARLAPATRETGGGLPALARGQRARETRVAPHRLQPLRPPVRRSRVGGVLLRRLGGPAARPDARPGRGPAGRGRDRQLRPRRRRVRHARAELSVAGPQWARAMDRRGQGRDPPLGDGRPTWSPASRSSTAVVAGAPAVELVRCWPRRPAPRGPNIGSLVRARWAGALDARPTGRPRSPSRRSSTRSSSSSARRWSRCWRPSIAPPVGFLTGVVLGAVGGLWLAAQRATEPAGAAGGRGGAGRRRCVGADPDRCWSSSSPISPSAWSSAPWTSWSSGSPTAEGAPALRRRRAGGLRRRQPGRRAGLRRGPAARHAGRRFVGTRGRSSALAAQLLWARRLAARAGRLPASSPG